MGHASEREADAGAREGFYKEQEQDEEGWLPRRHDRADERKLQVYRLEITYIIEFNH